MTSPTFESQGAEYRQIPVLILFVEVNLGRNDPPKAVFSASSSVFQTKFWSKIEENHENRVLYFGHMAPLFEMLKILLYQLEILSKKVFLHYQATRLLSACTDSHFSAPKFHLEPLLRHQP